MRKLFLISFILVLIVPMSGCGGGKLAERVAEKIQAASLDEAIPEGGEVLFKDDFQDGKPDGWQITQSWTVQQQGETYVFAAKGPGGAAWVPQGGKWADYVYRAGVRLDTGSVALGFRASKEGQYLLYWREDGLYLVKEYPKGQFTPLTQTAAPSLKVGTGLAIAGYQGHLQVYVGKTLQMDYVDPSPLLQGTLGVAVPDNCAAAVDNVMAIKLSKGLPAPAAAALPAPIAAPAVASLGQQGLPLENLPAAGEVVPLAGEVAPPSEGEGAPSEGEEAPVIFEEDEEPVAEDLPVIDYFNSEPVPERPGCFYLHWDVHNATAVYLDEAGVTAPGSQETCQAGGHTLRAENAAGSVQASVNLTAGLSPTAQADLVVSRASVELPGDPGHITVHLGIRNVGDASAGSFTVRWFPHDKPNTPVGCTGDILALPAGAEASSTCDYTYAERGEMHWHAEADADNDIQESNENNNSMRGTTTISGGGPAPTPTFTPAPGGKPDLVITDAHFEPAQATKGQVVKMVMKVKNAGNAQSGPFSVIWHFNAALGLQDCTWERTQGLAAGAEFGGSCTRTPTIDPGSAPTELTADDDNSVAESNENNNTSDILPLTVNAASAQKPDLVITDAHFEPAQATKGQVVKMVMKVKNAGNAQSGPFSVIWHFNATLGLQDCTWERTQGLAAGAEFGGSCTRTPTIEPGSAPTELTVDDDNSVAESNESNNKASNLPLTVNATSGGGGEKPDLVITDAHFEPAQATKGQVVKMVMKVKNAGNAQSGPFSVVWHFNAALGLQDCTWERTQGLAAGGEFGGSCTRTPTIEPGSAPTELTVDDDNSVAESNESNNKASNLPLTVKAASGGGGGGGGEKPDLVITDAHLEPAEATKGQVVKMVMKVKNAGNAQSGPFSVIWHFNATLGLQDCTWERTQGLAAGGEFSGGCTRTPTIEPGSAPTQLIVDDDNSVAESNENNNKSDIMMKIKAPTVTKPDLIIASSSFAPPKVISGQTFKANVTVKNAGNAASGPFKIRWQFPAAAGLTDCTWTSQSLAAGASYAVSCDRKTQAPPGSISSPSTLTVDVDGAVAESNENNNVAKPVFTVDTAVVGNAPPGGPPDLVVEGYRLMPNPVLHAHEFEYEYTVKNVGNSPASPSKARWHAVEGAHLPDLTCSVPALMPGASHRCTYQIMSAPAQPKGYGTWVDIDVDHVVNEAREDNNQAKVDLQVN